LKLLINIYDNTNHSAQFALGNLGVSC
jgi:hypothetical protein